MLPNASLQDVWFYVSDDIIVVLICISLIMSDTDWKRSVFIPIPKKGNAKECSNYHTIALISHASKVISKFCKPGFSNM